VRRDPQTHETTLTDEEFALLDTNPFTEALRLREENVNLRENMGRTLNDLRRDRLAGCICQHGAIQHRLEQDRACLACDCKRYCCLPGVAGAPFGMRF
jgi:hypothetical protein